MKKYILLAVSFIVILSLFACGGNVSKVEITAYQSEQYESEEIESAIQVVKAYFKKEFSGCTLTEITYAGDDITSGYIDWVERNDGEDVIVLVSSFDVDASGGDGSLNPNSTYNGWKWILVRRNGGKWQHVDHGY